MKIICCFYLFFLCVIVSIHADDFFTIKKIDYYSQQPPSKVGVYRSEKNLIINGKSTVGDVYVPCLEVQISVKDVINRNAIFAKAYFYDQDKKLITILAAPSPRAFHADHQFYDWPEVIPKELPQFIYFAIPDQVLQQTAWSVIVVLGDSKGIDSHLYPPTTELTDYDYPEKNLLQDRNGPPIERKPTLDPLVEHVEQTEDTKHSQITLFMRPPLGMTDASQAQGVLCMCLVGDTIAGVKKQLQGFEQGQDLNRILTFAEEHKLIIICWGSQKLWDPSKNWDELDPDIALKADKEFDRSSEAWARGIKYFIETYGIPANGYLLWGQSAAAQYACRLALRKPEYFLAVYVHIPSSFDKPTPEANKVLWCLTTGELESGHGRSLRFYAQCRDLGYPIIYKAIVGLGHTESPRADSLGKKFFEYALSVRDQRLALDQSVADPLAQSQATQTDIGQLHPWLDTFRNPLFVGDIVNQEMFPYEQQNMVPTGYRVSLPTKAIADAWSQ